MFKNYIMKQKIIIPGGSGFIGTFAAEYFTKLGFEVLILSRKKQASKNGIQYLEWDGKTLGAWSQAFEGAKLILNLAGKNVNCRYHKANKKAILESRTQSTKVIGEAINQCKNPPEIWMNAASATIYRHTIQDPANDEINGKIGSGFSVKVCKEWEATFNAIDAPKTRKIILRTAITLGKDGGVMVPLKRLVSLGLGGKQGSGEQFVSWIHIEDFARIIEWLMENETQEGVFNCSSPSPVPNKEFMLALKKATWHVIGLPAPAWILELGAIFIRTETELILKSRKVFPKRLLDGGFEFNYPKLKTTMLDLVGGWS